MVQCECGEGGTPDRSTCALFHVDEGFIKGMGTKRHTQDFIIQCSVKLWFESGIDTDTNDSSSDNDITISVCQREWTKNALKEIKKINQASSSKSTWRKKWNEMKCILVSLLVSMSLRQYRTILPETHHATQGVTLFFSSTVSFWEKTLWDSSSWNMFLTTCCVCVCVFWVLRIKSAFWLVLSNSRIWLKWRF